MPERGFATETWDSDDWFQELSRDQRYLFIYLWSNNHCTPAGLYHITLTTIAFEAKFSKEELPDLLHSLAPKVKWYPDQNLIWVRNFIKRQSKSPKFLAAAAKCLTSIHHNGAIQELLDYNFQRYSVLIPYQYYMDRLSIPTATATVTGTDPDTVNGLGGSRGEGDNELAVISRLYEENIGSITQMVSEKLKDIASRYPEGWFKEALAEAIEAGVRKLTYLEAILDRWQVEGFKSPKGGSKDEQRKGQRVKGARPSSDFSSGKW